FADAPDEGQALAVGRRRRPARAAGRVGQRRGLACDAIVLADLPDAGMHVAVVGVALGAAGEVDVAPLAREHRLVRVAELLLLGDLHALAAQHAVHPQLDRAEGALVGEPPPGHDPLAVRRPRRRVGGVVGLAAYRPRTR